VFRSPIKVEGTTVEEAWSAVVREKWVLPAGATATPALALGVAVVGNIVTTVSFATAVVETGDFRSNVFELNETNPAARRMHPLTTNDSPSAIAHRRPSSRRPVGAIDLIVNTASLVGNGDGRNPVNL